MLNTTSAGRCGLTWQWADRGHHLMVSDMYAGRRPAEGGDERHLIQLFPAICSAAFAESRFARCTSISAFEIAWRPASVWKRSNCLWASVAAFVCR